MAILNIQIHQQHIRIKIFALKFALCVLLSYTGSLCITETSEAIRLKDIADIEGVRENQLIGYGLIVGLSGTGDKTGTNFTSQSMSNMLERLGMRVDPKELKLANVAAVIVTAVLPPFARPGTKLDISLSSIGDAKSLQGGVLVLTPLHGPDGKVYAVAQGPISVGGFSISEGQGDSAQKNHPTVARIAGGAIIERSIPFDLFATGQIRIVLREPDFETIRRLEVAINETLGLNKAVAIDSASIVLPLESSFVTSPVELLAKLEHVDIQPDIAAKVIVNERTGTIIMGENVKVSTIALSHGNLNITIRSETQVSQPNAFGKGDTAVVKNTQLSVSEEPGKISIVGPNVNLRDLVNALNRLGATPRDLIAIFQALKKAGALQAELIVM